MFIILKLKRTIPYFKHIVPFYKGKARCNMKVQYGSIFILNEMALFIVLNSIIINPSNFTIDRFLVSIKFEYAQTILTA